MFRKKIKKLNKKTNSGNSTSLSESDNLEKGEHDRYGKNEDLEEYFWNSSFLFSNFFLGTENKSSSSYGAQKCKLVEEDKGALKKERQRGKGGLARRNGHENEAAEDGLKVHRLGKVDRSKGKAGRGEENQHRGNNKSNIQRKGNQIRGDSVKSRQTNETERKQKNNKGNTKSGKGKKGKKKRGKAMTICCFLLKCYCKTCKYTCKCLMCLCKLSMKCNCFKCCCCYWGFMVLFFGVWYLLSDLFGIKTPFELLGDILYECLVPDWLKAFLELIKTIISSVENVIGKIVGFFKNPVSSIGGLLGIG